MFASHTRGHLTVTGTGEQVADVIEHWVAAGACDGFNIAPALIPQSLEAFVSEVIPVLRQRGAFRTEYTGTTLRDHLGLAKPRHASAPAAST